MSFYIGLMSGTSLDAIDASLVEIDEAHRVRHIDSISFPIPEPLKEQIAALMQANYPDHDAIELYGHCHTQLGHVFADAAKQLIEQHDELTIRAIGSHGQTIRHRPELETAFTLQIGDASVIAEKTGITTITDFRSRDIAAGGQGAPLVPAFHRHVFSSTDQNRCAINIGGMANISYLAADRNEPTTGFDTGPGNILLDTWCQINTDNSFDLNGEWARSGQLNETLLSAMLSDPYFSQEPPKSTGREHFNQQWIEERIGDIPDTPVNIQRTLTELTARSISDSIKQYFPLTEQLIVCGGGARNQFLLERLEACCAIPARNSDDYNIHSDWVEAVAFAWLAHCTLERIPANEPAVTGARAPVILGAIYPA